jgi:hypothetical protein
MKIKQAEVPKEEKVEAKTKPKPFFDLWTIILVAIIALLVFSIVLVLSY